MLMETSKASNTSLPSMNNNNIANIKKMDQSSATTLLNPTNLIESQSSLLTSSNSSIMTTTPSPSSTNNNNTTASSSNILNDSTSLNLPPQLTTTSPGLSSGAAFSTVRNNSNNNNNINNNNNGSPFMMMVHGKQSSMMQQQQQQQQQTNNYSQDLFDYNNTGSIIFEQFFAGQNEMKLSKNPATPTTSLFGQQSQSEHSMYYNQSSNNPGNSVYMTQNQQQVHNNKFHPQSQTNQSFSNVQLLNKIATPPQQQQPNRNSTSSSSSSNNGNNNKSLKSSNALSVLSKSVPNSNKNLNHKIQPGGSSNHLASNLTNSKSFSTPSSAKSLWNNNKNNGSTTTTITPTTTAQQSSMMMNGLFSASVNSNSINNHLQNSWLPNKSPIATSFSIVDESNSGSNNANQQQQILNSFAGMMDPSAATNHLINPMLHQQSSRSVKIPPYVNLQSGETIQQLPINHPRDSQMIFINPPMMNNIYSSFLQTEPDQQNVGSSPWTSWDQQATSSTNITMTASTNTNSNVISNHQPHDHQDSNVCRDLFNVWSPGSSTANDSLILDPMGLGDKMVNNKPDSRSVRMNNHLAADNDSMWPDHWGSSVLVNDGMRQPMMISPMVGSKVNQTTNNLINNEKQIKRLLDFYHDNLMYFMNRDLKMSKMMSDSYSENFCRSSTFELEQIILNRFLTRKSNDPNIDAEFGEFADIYYDFQEHEKGSQYLDKVLLQSKFENLKELYTSMFAGDVSGINLKSGNHSSTTAVSSTSLDANKISNNQNLIEEKLKQIQSEAKHHQEIDNGETLLLTMLRLLKFRRKLLNILPKELLLNYPWIEQMEKHGQTFRNTSEETSDESDCDKESEEGGHQKQFQQRFQSLMSILKQISNDPHILQQRQQHHNNNDNTVIFHSNTDTKNSDQTSLQQRKDKTSKSSQAKSPKNSVDGPAIMGQTNLRIRKLKIYDQIIGVKLDPSIYFPYYYPMSVDHLNMKGPILVFFNRPAKPPKISFGNVTHNWSMIESIEYEVHKSGMNGALVWERLDNCNSVHNTDATPNACNELSVMSTSMNKLINRLKDLFPNIPKTQLLEVIRQAKFILMKRYKIQYGFSGIKMGQLVKFVTELIIENGISLTSSTNNNETGSKTTSTSGVAASTGGNVTKGISWSKIAAQSNNNNSCASSSIPTTPITKEIGNCSAVTMSPIMKPTPSSTPLSSTSSSSISCSPSLNQVNNSFKATLSTSTNNFTISSTANSMSPSNTLNHNIFSLHNNLNENVNNNNNINSNCALCKNMISDAFLGSNKNNQLQQTFRLASTNNASSKASFKMPHCKHLFHKECFDNIASTTQFSPSSNKTAGPINSMINNNICPICEKLFILRKDEFPSLN